MPELPEVETIVRVLRLRLVGQRLGPTRCARRDVLHGNAAAIKRVVPQARVADVTRQGKRVIVLLKCEDRRPKSEGKRRCSSLHQNDSALLQKDTIAGQGMERQAGTSHLLQLIFHLGMSGRLTLVAEQEPVEQHTHLRIAVPVARRELRFRDPRRFGGVWCITGTGRWTGKRLGPLGADPLSITPAQFRRLLLRRRAIKALLMDQTIIAGLGNICCDESLFAAAVHPQTPANSIDAPTAGRLLRAIKTTLRRAIRFNGSTLADYRTADGDPGDFQRLHRVYQRAGKPCRRCGTPIVRILSAGRSTHFCVRCQPRPVPITR